MPAHIKASLLGPSLSLPVSRGRLALGTWQGVYLCEHRDHGGARSLVVTLFGESPSARARPGRASRRRPWRLRARPRTRTPARRSRPGAPRSRRPASRRPTPRCASSRRSPAGRCGRSPPRARARRRARSPGSVSRETTPICAARSAPIGSPVRASSIARWYGIRRGRRSSAPAAATSPRLTSGMPKRASRAATMRSHDSATSKPPASAQPSTAAISGLRGGALGDAGEAAVADVRALAGHERLQVHARAERAAGAGEDARAQRLVLVEPVERGGDALGDGQVDRVARLRPVDGDDEDLAVGLGADGGHPNSVSAGSRSPRSSARSTSTQSSPRASASTRACGLTTWAASTPRQSAIAGSSRMRSR